MFARWPYRKRWYRHYISNGPILHLESQFSSKRCTPVSGQELNVLFIPFVSIVVEAPPHSNDVPFHGRRGFRGNFSAFRNVNLKLLKDRD